MIMLALSMAIKVGVKIKICAYLKLIISTVTTVLYNSSLRASFHRIACVLPLRYSSHCWTASFKAATANQQALYLEKEKVDDQASPQSSKTFTNSV